MPNDANSLAGAQTLIVDNDRFTRNLVVQMLRGFDLPEPGIASDGAAAQTYITEHAPDICLCEAVLPDMRCNSLIHWIRRHAPEAVRMMPVIVLTNQTHRSTVTEARDSGASVIVKKPLSARVLLDHIKWAAGTQRNFVSSPDYVGPDRRFRAQPAPEEGDRRRNGRPKRASGQEDTTTAFVRGEIAAIEDILAQSPTGLDYEARQRVMAHGQHIATAAGRAGYAHLEIAARGLCDALAGLTAQDPRGTAPVGVHLQALQLLALGDGTLTTMGAERILDELSRMLAHLGIFKHYNVPPQSGDAKAEAS